MCAKKISRSQKEDNLQCLAIVVHVFCYFVNRVFGVFFTLVDNLVYMHSCCTVHQLYNVRLK